MNKFLQNIASGIYSIFEGMGSITLFPNDSIEIKGDYEALKSDWDKVNKDFESILGKYKNDE